MSALINPKPKRESAYKYISMPLATGVKATRGGRACVDTSAHSVKPFAAANANLVPVGYFEDSYDNTSGSTYVYVNVKLDKEVFVQWYDSVTGGNAVSTSVAGTSLFQTVYGFSDHEVTTSSSTNSTAGRVWDCNATNGVAVQNTVL